MGCLSKLTWDMYCRLKALRTASKRLEAGPPPATGVGVEVNVLLAGWNEVIMSWYDEGAAEKLLLLELLSPLKPNPLQAPTVAAFFPFPCLNRDLRNQELWEKFKLFQISSKVIVNISIYEWFEMECYTIPSWLAPLHHLEHVDLRILHF